MTALPNIPRTCTLGPAEVDLTNPLGLYLNSLKHVPWLSREEEARLDERSRAGDVETSDYYTSHLHLRGKRTTAAFLLKGPVRFA